MISNSVTTARETLLFGLDYWKTAAENGPLLFKTMEFGVSASELAEPFFGVSAIGNVVRAVGLWAKPSGTVLRAFTDGVEPLKGLYNDGARWANEARTFNGVWYKNEALFKLASRTALVAGLAIGVPLYLSSVGFFAVPIALSKNIGIFAVLSVIELGRSTLITFGIVYNFYEKEYYNKTVERAKDLEVAQTKERVWTYISDSFQSDGAGDTPLRKAEFLVAMHKLHALGQQVLPGIVDNPDLLQGCKDALPVGQAAATAKSYAEKAHREAKACDLQLKKELAGIGDDATKILGFTATICATFIMPFSAPAVTAVLAMGVFNKWCGVSKAYHEAKGRELALVRQVKDGNTLPVPWPTIASLVNENALNAGAEAA